MTMLSPPLVAFYLTSISIGVSAPRLTWAWPWYARLAVFIALNAVTYEFYFAVLPHAWS